MTDLRQIYNARMNRYFYIALVCHLPIMLMAAYFFETSIRQALVFSLLILIGPSLAYFSNKESNLTASVMAVAGIFFSGLLIHLGKGMIEMHFHIFVFLATLTLFGLKTPILAATVTVVVHHLGFFFLLPESIFNYQASFAIVLLHAAFVVAEDIGLLFIGHMFGKLIVSQGNSLLILEQLAKQNQKDSSHLDDSVRSLAALTQEHLASTAEMSSGINDVQLKVESNTEELNESIQIVSEVQEQSQSAMNSMTQMSENMADISNSVKSLGEIEDIMSQMSDKLSVINDIVFKTQLLSFNASIEAARAGQHGRGFAVVAEEVGSLALSSGTASKEIQNLLENSGGKVNQIVSQIQSRVENAVTTTDSTHKQFNQLFSRLGEVNSIVSRVGERNHYFLESFTQFNTALDMLKRASAENDNITQKVQELAGSGKASSLKLAKLVEDTKSGVQKNDEAA